MLALAASMVHADRTGRWTAVNVIILVVCATTILVAVLLTVVVVGIKVEPPASELSTKAPTLTAAIVRHALGVSVRKPTKAERVREAHLTGQASSNCLNGRDQWTARPTAHPSHRYRFIRSLQHTANQD
jgi:hypothetical protein